MVPGQESLQDRRVSRKRAGEADRHAKRQRYAPGGFLVDLSSLCSNRTPAGEQGKRVWTISEGCRDQAEGGARIESEAESFPRRRLVSLYHQSDRHPFVRDQEGQGSASQGGGAQEEEAHRQREGRQASQPGQTPPLLLLSSLSLCSSALLNGCALQGSGKYSGGHFSNSLEKVTDKEASKIRSGVQKEHERAQEFADRLYDESVKKDREEQDKRVHDSVVTHCILLCICQGV
eukprot:649023-Hanusia_phi.AAC.1